MPGCVGWIRRQLPTGHHGHRRTPCLIRLLESGFESAAIPCCNDPPDRFFPDARRTQIDLADIRFHYRNHRLRACEQIRRPRTSLPNWTSTATAAGRKPALKSARPQNGVRRASASHSRSITSWFCESLCARNRNGTTRIPFFDRDPVETFAPLHAEGSISANHRHADRAWSAAVAQPRGATPYFFRNITDFLRWPQCECR